MILGAIGDDFTGSSDLGLTLANGGLRTAQYVGVPSKPADNEVEAGIVALKTRTMPVADAVKASLAAYRWLRDQGCQQILLKYCSTFDSRRDGNIGPAIEALIEEAGTSAPVIVCPAFPATGRTIYQGHLFVGDRLLSESGMEAHPLTPMVDPDIRRWLGHQTKSSVGHLTLDDIRNGKAREALLSETNSGRQIIVCDAISDCDLKALGKAAEGFPLITGGSGIAIGLPELLIGTTHSLVSWRCEKGPALAIAGSCSKTTRAQIAYHRVNGGALRRIDVSALYDGQETVNDVINWAMAQTTLPLVYTSDDPQVIKNNQQKFGTEKSAQIVENFFAKLARAAVEAGFVRLITAGGETSGAVVEALEADTLEIGPTIAVGVPALRVSGRNLVLALKSGNFGAENFFTHAAQKLEET